ncbi:O-antigen ligase family protein [Neobittarella massiliensis]|uniref:O-antigen ligase family protein n=1 Tax=Neobittarella massiliensis (ex Bilen et al. 2018) TaxID=2041842 RepID=A0A8J6IPB2_9FIRM|nr:O-antigen ligase family protein [Neobittarella massiliensis]MBC3516415.1 O-antigen ligase family protein [Neobittarella massiliensis]
MTEESKIKKSLQIFLIGFILLQPFLDTIYLYSENVISIFGFSPSTIVRFAAVAVLLAALLFAKWVPAKTKIVIGAYLGVVLIYFVLHHLAAGSFVLHNGKVLDYSILSEFFYVCRLTLPILLIFITYYIGVPLKSILKVFVWLSLIMSSIIIASNLLCISLDSYTNETIKANIFSWFTDGYRLAGFNGLASKGFFYFANQISAVFMMIFPIVFLVAVRQKSILAGATLILQSIAMIMLGTKIATFGMVLAMVFCLCVYLFFVIIHKEKWNWIALSVSLLVLLLGVILIPRSPALFRLDVHNNTVSINQQSEVDETSSKSSSVPQSSASSASVSVSSSRAEKTQVGGQSGSIPNASLTKEEKLQYIEENYERLKINKRFILEAYPYEYDPDFWYDILCQPAEKRLDNRFIELSMIQRAKVLGATEIHDLFGISYNKMSSFFNVERDIVSQYYSMGIIGVILFFGPFFLFLLGALYLLFRNFKKNFHITNVLLTAPLAIVLLAGFISGNTLDNMFVTILMGFLCAGLCKSLREAPMQ